MNKSTRQMHAFPPEREDRKTTYICHKCDKSVCLEHLAPKFEGTGMKKTLSEVTVCVIMMT